MIKANDIGIEMYQHHVPPFMKNWQEHNIIPVMFLPKMPDLNVNMRKFVRQTQITGHPIKLQPVC